MTNYEQELLAPGARTLVFLTVTAFEPDTESVMIAAAYAALEGLQGQEIPGVHSDMSAGLRSAAKALGRVRAAGLTHTIVPGQRQLTIGVADTFSTVMLMVEIEVHTVGDTAPDQAEVQAAVPVNPLKVTADDRWLDDGEAMLLIEGIWGKFRPGGSFGAQLAWLARLGEHLDLDIETVPAPEGNRPAGVKFTLLSGCTVTVYPAQVQGGQTRVLLSEGVTDGMALLLFKDIHPDHL
jgi:hypothetical protein